MVFESIAENCCDDARRRDTRLCGSLCTPPFALAGADQRLAGEWRSSAVLMTPALLLIVVFIAYPFSLGLAGAHRFGWQN